MAQVLQKKDNNSSIHIEHFFLHFVVNTGDVSNWRMWKSEFAKKLEEQHSVVKNYNAHNKTDFKYDIKCYSILPLRYY